MSINSIVRFLIDGMECPPADTLYYARPETIHGMHDWRKVNSVWNWRGRRPGEAHLLATKQMVNALPLQTDTAVQLSMSFDSQRYDWDYWYITKCEAIETIGVSTDQQLFYLMLQDPRVIADRTIISDSWSLFPDCYQYNIESTMTWQEVLDALWVLMPTAAYANSGTCPTLATTPVSSPENLNFDGLSLWRAICQALEACGHFPVYDITSGEYRFAAYNDVQAGLSTIISNNAGNLIWAGDAPNLHHAYPETISVIFQPELHSRLTKATYAQPHIESVASGITGSFTGTSMAIVDTTFCVRTNGIVENPSQLANRLIDLTRTIHGKAKACNFAGTSSWSTIIPTIMPGEQLSCVVFGAQMRRPSFTQAELIEPFEFDLPKPPDRAYSLVEVVLITSNAPDADGYYDGTVQRWNHETLTWDSLYNCKVKDLSL